jgi:c-di-GMP-binding flagellar brake protein YcgR
MTSTSGMRLGCEFLALDAGTERSLQRYIDQTQKRRRLLSLD